MSLRGGNPRKQSRKIDPGLLRFARNDGQLNTAGHSLLELIIALAIGAILFVVIDKVYASLWLTRKALEQAQESHRARELPQQLFADLLYHAGFLGCRAVRDGIEIKVPLNLPEAIFIQRGEAVQIRGNELWVHETRNQGLSLNGPILEDSLLKPVSLKDKSDWLLISDCKSAEILPYGGRTSQAYEDPIYLSPVILYRWSLNNHTLYRQQNYPSTPAQPVLTPVEAWEWGRRKNLVHLRWKMGEEWDEFIFELGNS